MTTMPTLWGTEVTFSFDPLAFGPRIATLRDGTFVLTWESQTGDIFGRHLSEFGSFTGGDFLTQVSSTTTQPLFSPIPLQQTDGFVVVNFGLLFDDSPIDRDVYWHRPNLDFSPHGSKFGTEVTANDEVLGAFAPLRRHLDNPRQRGRQSVVFRVLVGRARPVLCGSRRRRRQPGDDLAGRNRLDLPAERGGQSWFDVYWSPELGLFCAVASSGSANRVMTSPDGISWAMGTSAADNSWFGVCWSRELGLFCAVSLTGAGDRVMTSRSAWSHTYRGA